MTPDNPHREHPLARHAPSSEEAAPVEELAAICAVLGCTTKPGVALRFASELLRDLQRARERQVELLRTWDDASLTERQELDRLRRGWGPSTPTERMARRTDLRAAMTLIERAMGAVLPDDKEDDDLTLDHFQTAYDKLSEGHREIIALLQAIPDLSAPDLPSPSGVNAEAQPVAWRYSPDKGEHWHLSHRFADQGRGWLTEPLYSHPSPSGVNAEVMAALKEARRFTKEARTDHTKMAIALTQDE